MTRLRYAACLLLFAAVPTMAQQLQFDTMIRDLGEMKQLESRDVQFTVYNKGRDTLHLGRVQAGCGCTQARLSSSILAPQDSAILSVTFSTGPHMLGEITKTVTLGTLYGTQEVNQQKLRIRAKVVGKVRFSPERITFRTTVGDTVHATVQLMSNTAETVEISEITPVLTAFVDTSRSGGYRASTVRSEPFDALEITPSAHIIHPGTTEKLDIMFIPRDSGQITGFIRLAISSSEIRISVTGVVRPE